VQPDGEADEDELGEPAFGQDILPGSMNGRGGGHLTNNRLQKRA
jgi:hypothetical protein